MWRTRMMAKMPKLGAGSLILPRLAPWPGNKIEARREQFVAALKTDSDPLVYFLNARLLDSRSRTTAIQTHVDQARGLVGCLVPNLKDEIARLHGYSPVARTGAGTAAAGECGLR
jgi:hypothetical protein